MICMKHVHCISIFNNLKFVEELLNTEIQQKLDNSIKHDIKNISMAEYEFWKLLTDTHLKPTSEAFTMIEELKS